MPAGKANFLICIFFAHSFLNNTCSMARKEAVSYYKITGL